MSCVKADIGHRRRRWGTVLRGRGYDWCLGRTDLVAGRDCYSALPATMMAMGRAPTLTLRTVSCSPSLVTAGKVGAGGGFEREDGGMRGPASLALGDELFEIGGSFGVGVIRDRRGEGEVALGGDALMSAVGGEITVAEGINSSFDDLAAAVRAFFREAEDSQERALCDRKRDGLIGRLGAGRDVLRNQISHQGPDGPVTRYPSVDFRSIRSRKPGRRGRDGFEFVILSETKAVRQRKRAACLIMGGREIIGAGDGIRTRDIDLGKVALYQLSYSRPIGKSHFHPKRW